MDLEKDNFEDENELSRLEEDEELGGEAQEIVETEEEELAIVGEEPEEGAPAAKPAPKPAAKKAVKKKVARKKKAKRAKPRKKAAKKGKKKGKRAGKRRR